MKVSEMRFSNYCAHCEKKFGKQYLGNCPFCSFPVLKGEKYKILDRMYVHASCLEVPKKKGKTKSPYLDTLITVNEKGKIVKTEILS